MICDTAAPGEQHCRACGAACHGEPPRSTTDGTDGPRSGLCTGEVAATLSRSARNCQQRQAGRMLKRLRDFLHQFEAGVNVRVGIPNVDRARNQQRNVIRVVIQVAESERASVITFEVQNQPANHDFLLSVPLVFVFLPVKCSIISQLIMLFLCDES